MGIGNCFVWSLWKLDQQWAMHMLQRNNTVPVIFDTLWLTFYSRTACCQNEKPPIVWSCPCIYGSSLSSTIATAQEVYWGGCMEHDSFSLVLLNWSRSPWSFRVARASISTERTWLTPLFSSSSCSLPVVCLFCMKLHLETYGASSKKYLFGVLTVSPLICVRLYRVWQVTQRSSHKTSQLWVFWWFVLNKSRTKKNCLTAYTVLVILCL